MSQSRPVGAGGAAIRKTAIRRTKVTRCRGMMMQRDDDDDDDDDYYY